jgi:hypothetical protein
VLFSQPVKGALFSLKRGFYKWLIKTNIKQRFFLTIKTHTMKLQLKKWLPLAAPLCLLVTLTWQCRKTDAPAAENAASNRFDAKAAQEWWWGSFRKSPQAKSVNIESPFAWFILQGSRHRGGERIVKLPQFNLATSYKVGNMQVVEAPLVYPESAIAIPGAEKQSAAENKLIAGATLQRALFIKTADGKITPRLLTIIPSYSYAARHQFDISHNSFAKLDKDFSGFMFIRQWDETPLKLFAVENGKKTKNLTLTVMPAAARGNTGTGPDSPDDCGWQQVEVIHRWCIVAADELGENPPPASECSNWQEETAFEWQWICSESEGGGTPADCGNISGITYEECMCYYYSVCNDNGGGGGVEDETEVVKTEAWHAFYGNVYGTWATVWATDRLKGKRNSSEPQGGHFTKIVFLGTECRTQGVIWDYWGNQVSYSGQTASSRVTGKITRGTSDPLSTDRTNNYTFAEVFP